MVYVLAPTREDEPHEDIESGVKAPQYQPFTLLLDSDRTQSFYGTDGSLVHNLPRNDANVIRFQVVIWHIGEVDAVLSKVDMRFRITLYWNIPDCGDEKVGYGMHNPLEKKVWAMIGRQRAYQRSLKEVDEGNRIVYVPPISILNAVDFQILGDPEVCLIDEETNLMKWSCLYKASMMQENLMVCNFPHDSHDLIMRFAILKHRQHGKRWDRRKWKYGLATRNETEESTSIPHGLIVEHVKVPGFSYSKNRKLDFDFVPFELGGGMDECLQVKINVTRDSSYYDRNIIPLLAALNLATLCILVLDAIQLGARGEIILAAAFVEIGIRLTIDSRLPTVGYQIKIQMVLNNFFYGLLFLVFESSVVYTMIKGGHTHETVKLVDLACAVVELMHLAGVLVVYYLSTLRNERND